MKKLLCTVFVMSVACAVTPRTFAQPAKNPVTTVAREILVRQQKNLTAAVEEMPAAKFAFKPTEAQVSFGHMVLHMTDSNNHLCSLLGEAPAPKSSGLKETDAKEKLVAALQASFEYCGKALEKLDDAKLGDAVEGYGGKPATRAWALLALTNDWADHYGAAAMYLRLNGLLPPTAKK